ncbi:hypothetical protein GLOTRDRAFT_72118 [Gloeophyllum trabeum ATCC 11539]|uniref:CTLH domain-containing protein n=1 Tax=Gloeophyllum trabeum (strain ATCC 11539 / FP-39264 / Madison 617) TaxID=670483 RepID=S7QFZ9_GLOTA|nr:uncharacterized protein GLOTRDRAFT_72118 [Gloeophyllum trabeum ATCC 11539]EPQ58083.1 hypothetical protein GLOTRDRAFT_72118 [Gloeophyllum trabeum ATCC 11539]
MNKLTPNAHLLNPVPQYLVRVLPSPSPNDPDKVPNPQRALVIDYLFQNCYTDTAQALLNDSGVRQLDADGDEIMTPRPSDALSLPPEAIRSLELRREIRGNILAGRIDQATDMVNKHFPTVLSAPPSSLYDPQASSSSQFLYARSLEPMHINLNLRIQAFIEAVRTVPLNSDSPTPAHADTDAHKVQLIQSARKLNVLVQALPDADDRKRYSDELKHVMSLLAYTVPENSPVARYMGPERREAVADQVNSAILHRTGYQSVSGIELSARYTSVIWSFLHEMEVKSPAESSRPAGIRLNPTTESPSPASALSTKTTGADKDNEIVPSFSLHQFLANP